MPLICLQTLILYFYFVMYASRYNQLVKLFYPGALPPTCHLLLGLKQSCSSYTDVGSGIIHNKLGLTPRTFSCSQYDLFVRADISESCVNLCWEHVLLTFLFVAGVTAVPFLITLPIVWNTHTTRAMEFISSTCTFKQIEQNVKGLSAKVILFISSLSSTQVDPIFFWKTTKSRKEKEV